MSRRPRFVKIFALDSRSGILLTSSVGRFGLSQMGSYGTICRSVSRSASRKAVSKKRRKECIRRRNRMSVRPVRVVEDSGLTAIYISTERGQRSSDHIDHAQL